jgi:hypothetical protein
MNYELDLGAGNLLGKETASCMLKISNKTETHAKAIVNPLKNSEIFTQV